MPFDRTRVRIVAFGAVLSVLACAPILRAADWHRVDSSNFVVVGDVSVGALQDIAVRFETFRETLGRVLTHGVTGTAAPTVVMVFSSDRAFTPFKPKFNGKPIELSGLFLGRPDVSYIAINAEAATDGLRVVFHEYAHLIISNASRRVPMWLNEGLAEYYSTYQVQNGGRGAVVGGAITPHLLLLNHETLLPLETLLKVTEGSPLYNEGERRSVFYAQSWALTHMLMLGEPRRAPQLARYLETLDQGVAAPDAWQQIFGSDAIERDLQKYIRLPVWTSRVYSFSDKLATFPTTPVPLTAGDADAFLADFLIQQDRLAEAADRLARRPATTALAPWPATVATLVQISKKNYADAEKHLGSIADAGDWLTAYRAEAALAELVHQRGDAPTREQVTTMRRLFAAVSGAGREIPNAAAALAALELAAGDMPSAATVAALDRARTIAPGRYDYVYLYARILARQSEFVAARGVLAPLLSPGLPADVREPARSLMEYMAQVERSRAAAGASTGRDRSPSDQAGPERPPVARPVFRKQDEGEQRLEGVLERIQCSPSGVAFHVRTADGPDRLTAARMEDVAFVTYRNDLSGIISCGPMADDMRVYVTWRPGPGAASKVAVAIEFLPKDREHETP